MDWQVVLFVLAILVIFTLMMFIVVNLGFYLGLAMLVIFGWPAQKT